MRGPRVIPYRSGIKAPMVNEADGVPVQIPAPYGGWNARGNLANMPWTDAIQMDNFFPGVQDVQLRKGITAWATGFGTNVRTLLPYESPTANKLFASTATAVYSITSGGAIGASVTTCTSGDLSLIHISEPTRPY